MNRKVTEKKRATRSLPKGHTPCAVSSLSCPAAQKTTHRLRKRVSSGVSTAQPIERGAGDQADGATGRVRRVSGASLSTACADQPNIVTQSVSVSAGALLGRGDHVPSANSHRLRVSVPLSETIECIRAYYDQRCDLLGSATALTLRMKAIVKSFRKLPHDAEVSEKLIKDTDYAPLVTLWASRDYIRSHLRQLEKLLEARAKELPGYEEIWSGTKGLGPLGLALIIGATGDLRNYSTPAKVWKRMGLHVYEGRALWTRRPGMTSGDWEAAGYCPQRRSIMYTIINLGICTKENTYHDLRNERREYERRKMEAQGVIVVPAAKIPKKSPEGCYMSEGHILNRANRYVAKRLLRDLWRVWRREASSILSKDQGTGVSRSPSESASETATPMPLFLQYSAQKTVAQCRGRC